MDYYLNVYIDIFINILYYINISYSVKFSTFKKTRYLAEYMSNEEEVYCMRLDE